MKTTKLTAPLTLVVLLTFVASCDGFGSSSSSANSSTASASVYTMKSDYSSKQIAIFSINDMHGKLDETSAYPGILNLEAAIRNDTHYIEGNTVILSAGDMWQGGYVSGYDKGKTTTELMNDFPFGAMALGNHEFDWGFDNIVSNEEVADFPFLCANLIEDATDSRPEGVEDHVTLDVNGFRLGVVGAIGASLESSIKASMIEGFSFSNDLTYIQSAADECRKEGAQSVVLLIHDDEYSDYVEAIRSDSSLGISAIFGGHSHRFQLDSSQVPYVQGGSDSKGYSYATIDKETNGLVSIGNVDITEEDLSFSASDYDQALKDDLEEAEAKVPVETFNEIEGDWSKKETANFVTKAMFEMVKDLYPGKDYSEENLVAVHNISGIRGSFPSSSTPMDLTMAEIQVVSPFDNQVQVLTDKHIDFDELNDYCYSYPESNALSSTGEYDIVTIDFLVQSGYSDMFDPGTGYYDISSDPTVPDSSTYIIFNLIADYAASLPSPIKASDYNW